MLEEKPFLSDLGIKEQRGPHRLWLMKDNCLREGSVPMRNRTIRNRLDYWLEMRDSAAFRA